MKIDSETERGIMLFASGIITFIVIGSFDYFLSPKCSIQVRQYAVPFVLLFDAFAIILLVAGMWTILKIYLKKRKRHKR